MILGGKEITIGVDGNYFTPDLPEGYDTDMKIGRPKEGEKCLIFHDGALLWVDPGHEALESSPYVCGIIATRKMRKIDMTPMIGQLCEFGAGAWIFRLEQIVTGIHYHEKDSTPDCKPIFGHTYAHAGGKCPVPKGFEYSVMLADREVYTLDDLAGQTHYWDSVVSAYDVISYTIIGLLPGWEL